MEHLTKQQIVLLTLFTTFITSIATGIVTVSLMDQAPPVVTGTVERVIEHTVDQVTGVGNSVSASASASASDAALAAGNAVGDTIASATAIAQKSIVRIQLLSDVNGGFGATSGSKITGLGIIVSKEGVIVTDKSTVAVQGNYVAILPDGNSVPIDILQSQDNGDIVFLLAEKPVTSTTTAGGRTTGVATTETFIPASFSATTGSDVPVLGETVIALSGADSTSISQGIIKKITTLASSTPTSYVTSIDPSETLIGSPLVDLSGDVVGIKTFSLESQGSVSQWPATQSADTYYPIGPLRSVVPVLKSAK